MKAERDRLLQVTTQLKSELNLLKKTQVMSSTQSFRPVCHDKEIQVPEQEIEMEQLQIEADFLRGSLENLRFEEARQTIDEMLSYAGDGYEEVRKEMDRVEERHEREREVLEERVRVRMHDIEEEERMFIV